MTDSRFATFSETIPAPVAPVRPVTVEQHGTTRTDPYAWMRAENWQAVLQDPATLPPEIRTHLQAENSYYEAMTADLSALRDGLFAEMRGRIKEDEASVPAPDGPFAYATRFREGGDYPVFFRTPRDGGAEEILYDGEAEGKDAEFFDIGAVEHSPDHSLIAYAVDRLGSEYFDIRFRRIENGEELPETLRNTDGGPVWNADATAIFYIERDEHQRPKRVKRHVLNTDPATDVLIYEEPDDGFFLSVGKSQSGAFILIESGNSVSSEVRFLRADAPAGTMPTLIAPRMADQLYTVDHHGDEFFILTNADGAIDFKIMRAPVATPGREHWTTWLTHSAGTYVLTFVPYKDRLVRLVRRNALPELIIATYDRTEEIVVGFEEEAYALGLDPGYEFDTDTLRFTYSSPTTPQKTFDYAMRSGVRTLRKTQEVPSGHDPSHYAVERIEATGPDGAMIPVTILRRRDVEADGGAPLLLYGYGAYGITIPASFSTGVLSIVDRGVVYAIAHIRGGAARGRQWYLDGKFDRKPNSFTDFIASAEHLQALGYGKTGGTVIYGGSAGGLLVGAALNRRPDLFAGAIGAVPFVDVLTTISDASLPLTPPEWDEWGNPIDDPEAFRTIAGYSPYDMIVAGADYPPVLATAGLADYRVTYWEPAKWIARLRSEAIGGPFLLRMNMEAGHAGSAARFESLRERAHEYAFALKVLGREEG